jgi:glycosyltransferase involved in cell wall biosynthesis
VVATNHLLPVNVIANSHLMPGGETLVWRYLRVFHNLADVVVSPSRTGAGFLAGAGVRRPIKVISNGVASRLFSPGSELPQTDGLNLMYVGRVDPEKQVDCLIRGVVAARRRVRVRLNIFGPCNDPHRLSSLITGMGAADYIRFHGVASEEEKRAALRQANAFCTASTAELECIAVLEAMASGLPIIAPAAGALPELVRPGITGLLFPPGSVSGLAEAIAEAASLPLSAMGHTARDLVCHERDEKATYAAYADLFNELCGGSACE